MLKPMLPTLIFEAPTGSNWVYEIKYDGFRAMLHWDKDRIQLVSRNGNLLNLQFPEIIKQCEDLAVVMNPYLPLVFDGELCMLESPIKASFELIQQRGRLKSEAKIAQTSSTKPAHYVVFDLLLLGGKKLMDHKFQDRKDELYKLCAEVELPRVDPTNRLLLQLVTYEKDFNSIWTKATQFNAEGIIAKKMDSTCGLSMGITPDLSVFGKFLIMFLMFIGRVGILNFIFIIGKKGKDVNYHYPKERLIIG